MEDLIERYLCEEKAGQFKTLALSRKGQKDKNKEGAELFSATTIEKKERGSLLLGDYCRSIGN